MAIGARGLPPEYPAWVDQWDEIRWGQSLSGNVPRGGRDDYADRAGLPRLAISHDGLEPLATAFDAAKRRWHPRRNSGISEFDPAPTEPAETVTSFFTCPTSECLEGVCWMNSSFLLFPATDQRLLVRRADRFALLFFHRGGFVGRSRGFAAGAMTTPPLLCCGSAHPRNWERRIGNY